jgi:hypothetical protein
MKQGTIWIAVFFLTVAKQSADATKDSNPNCAACGSILEI